MNLLEANAPTAGIGQISHGASITTNYNSPLVDSRTPDIIVAPNVGVVYTGSATKQAEHGGLANEDINMMLLVSNPGVKQNTIYQFVETKQVAPTIIHSSDLTRSSLRVRRF